MTEQSLASVAAVTANRPASAAVAERSEADHARARDVKRIIPEAHADGDKPDLAASEHAHILLTAAGNVSRDELLAVSG